MRHTKILLLSILAFLILTLGCNKSDESESINSDITVNESQVNSNNTDKIQTNDDNLFDRGKMMSFVTEEIIIPSYDNLNQSLEELKDAYDLFKIDITVHNFEDLRIKWINSYKLWQHVEMFNIGKSMEDYLNFKSNIYPVDTVRVKQNIHTGKYDLNNPNNYSAQGFPTMDYLLYGLNKDHNKVITYYLLDQEADKTMNYLGTLINDLANNVKAVKEDWYKEKDEFVKSIDNTASSNLNMMVNDFIFYYEKGFRTNKFGIPAGVFSSGALPDRVEGFYSKNFSKVLALEAMTSIKNFFNGISYINSEVSGHGLKSYLDFVESDSDRSISEDINAKLVIAENSIKKLDNDFSSQINSDITKVLKTYDDIQLTIVLIKVDMLQTLNIAVDYVDADGD